MDRLVLVTEDCMRELHAMRFRIETVVNRLEKYVDPDHALEPDSPSTLWERYDEVVARIAREFPALAKSVPLRKHPAGWEEPLDREDLQSFDRDIEVVLNLLNGKTNA